MKHKAVGIEQNKRHEKQRDDFSFAWICKFHRKIVDLYPIKCILVNASSNNTT
jgi:hypothetical protein